MNNFAKLAQVSCLIFLTFACARGPTKSELEIRALRKQIHQLQESQLVAQRKIEDQNNKILILATKLKDQNTTVVSEEVSGPENLKKKIEELAAANDAVEMNRTAELLEKGYKDSSLTPAALLNVADYYYKVGNYDKGLKSYMSILERYSEDPHVISAMFGAALCLKKIGKPQDAVKLFNKISTQFPGSVEAARAQEHLAKGKQ